MADIFYADDGYVDAGYYTVFRVASAAFSTTALLPDLYVLDDYMATGYVEGELLPSRTRDAGLDRGFVVWDDVTSWDNWLRTVWDPSGQRGVALPVISTLGAEPRASSDAAKDFVTTATLQATSTRILSSAQAAITAPSTVLAEPLKLRPASASLATVSTLNATATRTRPGAVALATVSSVSATPGRTRPGAMNSECASTLSATVNRIRFSSSSLQAFNTVVSATARLRGFGSAITATSTLNATAQKTASASTGLNSTVQLVSDSIRIGAVRCVLTGTASISAAPVRIRTGLPQTQVVTTSLTTLGGFRADGLANLEAFDFVLSTGRKIAIDYSVKVPGETRQYLVLSEHRELGVAQETRVNMVLEESRSITVPEETRLYSVI